MWLFYNCSVLICLLLSLCFRSYNYGNAVSTKPGFYKSARISDSTLKFIKDQNISGNIINSYSLGGQILFHFFPKIKVSIDSRIDAYGFDYMRDYRNTVYGKYSELKKFINRFEVKHMVINYTFLNNIVTSGKLNLLINDGWKIVHEKRGVVILSRF